eukprot:486740_1
MTGIIQNKNEFAFINFGFFVFFVSGLSNIYENQNKNDCHPDKYLNTLPNDASQYNNSTLCIRRIIPINFAIKKKQKSNNCPCNLKIPSTETDTHIQDTITSDTTFPFIQFICDPSDPSNPSDPSGKCHIN